MTTGTVPTSMQSQLLQQPAKFISFEGTEGVGKTTAIDNLCSKLTENKIAHIRTREPGGSAFAEQLRQMLLDPNTNIVDDTELLLMFAARNDHLHQVILPALDAGKWVICDRFVDSSVAYQGFGRAQGDANMLQKIALLSQHFVPKLPDLTLWLDLSIHIGMQRAGKRSAADRFEQESLAFFERVHAGFVHLAAAHPERITRIDASGDPKSVAQHVWQAIATMI